MGICWCCGTASRSTPAAAPPTQAHSLLPAEVSDCHFILFAPCPRLRARAYPICEPRTELSSGPCLVTPGCHRRARWAGARTPGHVRAVGEGRARASGGVPGGARALLSPPPPLTPSLLTPTQRRREPPTPPQCAGLRLPVLRDCIMIHAAVAGSESRPLPPSSCTGQ